MLSVVTYLWSPDAESRYSAYTADHVQLLQRMVKRHLSIPHRFIVVTDRPEQFAGDDEISAVPIDWTTHVPGTCFVRMFTFAPHAREALGERVLRIDLDTVIVGSLDALVDRDEDLVIWRNPSRWWMEKKQMYYNNRSREHPYCFWNTSLLLHSTGTLPHLWADFDPEALKGIDDDQHLSKALGPDLPYWDQENGVYRLENGHRRWRGSGANETLPDNARIVFFPGKKKPWLPEVMEQNPWISDHRF
jgi:hypothetical protein